ncbi:uncharacterized protein LOC131236177 isoform X2 [Magnolia sinica]|uniref:uncharacterized protein LOC131236177 isoform X2 n=1 Tax=Magnolia sinica TaxID=86752 RepID=UPI00265985D8|nr:uncharacterized protein LOC131236177 isoform X2 [Magnolia sinica]
MHPLKNEMENQVACFENQLLPFSVFLRLRIYSSLWQAYTNKLENKVSRLEEENERLKKQKVLDACCTCLTSNEIHFKNIRFKSSTNRGPGSAALYSSKQYNLNAVPLTESAMLLSPLQGNFPGRNLGSLQEKGLHHT